MSGDGGISNLRKHRKVESYAFVDPLNFITCHTEIPTYSILYM